MGLFWCYNDNVKSNNSKRRYTMAENGPSDDVKLLVNPGGRVVSVTAAHAEQLLASDEGFKEAPEGAKDGDSIDANGEPVAAQNELVPRGSTEEEAKRVAELQGTPENVKKQAAEDPTNDDVVTAPNTEGDMDTKKNDTDPGAGELGDSNTDNGDHPNTSGQANSTAADEAVVNGKASTGDANEQGSDDGKKAGRFFGRKK